MSYCLFGQILIGIRYCYWARLQDRWSSKEAVTIRKDGCSFWRGCRGGLRAGSWGEPRRAAESPRAGAAGRSRRPTCRRSPGAPTRRRRRRRLTRRHIACYLRKQKKRLSVIV